ncbi:MAG TPA: YceI family protein [Micromonosporaceae bacterium]|jgi:polyisoprenoid-binding protein YceI
MTRTINGLEIPDPGTYVFDPAHTVVGAVARHLMVTKVRGHFKEVTGTVTIAEDPLASSVEVHIKAASIDTGVPDRDNHMRSADFLDVENYPELTFKSTRIVKQDGADLVVAGDLTIHGVTREVELPVEFLGVSKSPWGTEVIGFSAATELNREDFGMTWNAALETGGVLVGPKLKVELEVEAIRQ